MEADQSKRDEYLEQISDILKDQLVYIDESGIDSCISKDMCWCKKGEVLHAKKSGKYYQRTNVIAGLNSNQSVAPMIFHGACNTLLFESWVEQFLIPELKPGQVIVMDNAAFHKSPRTRALIESAGCKLIFLPPYSQTLIQLRSSGLI